MPQIGIPYNLIGPDGTKAVFNDPSDPDFVGYLDNETGLTGLLDTADVRESTDPRPEGHGFFQGNNFLGRRVGTLSGFISPNVVMTTMNAYESKLKRASKGLSSNAPAILTWTPEGDITRRLRVWRQGRVTVAGRRPWRFLVPLASPDEYVSSADEASIVLTPTVAGGDQGFTSPMTDPIQVVYNVTGQQYVVNQGDAEAWPIFRIDGPITNPTIVNNSDDGLAFTLTYTLQAGDFLVVDSRTKSVLLGGTANRYSAYAQNFTINNWWPLLPGSNDVRLLAPAFSAGAQVTVYWRHAWE